MFVQCSFVYLRLCPNRSSWPLTQSAYPLCRTTMIGKESTMCHMPIGCPCLPSTQTIFVRDANQIGMDLIGKQHFFNLMNFTEHLPCITLIILQTSHWNLESFPKQIQRSARGSCPSRRLFGQENHSWVCDSARMESNIFEDAMEAWIHKWCAAVVV